MEDINIQIEEEGQKGRAFIGTATETKAEMTFSKAGDNLIIIDHTEVGDSLRGKGVGRLLLNALVKMAREREIKVMPLCPFAKSVFVKDPSIRDVLR